MALERQLKRWTEAGLLEPAQAERILALEKQESRPTLLYAIAGLGGLALAIGVLSIVAANWDVMPGRFKLGVALVCVLGMSFGVLRSIERGRSWIRETSILVLYGLVLASIALVGQVYQLGGNAAVALAAWSALTFLLMGQGRSALVGCLWLAGLELTCLAALLELRDAEPRLRHLALCAIYWAPLVSLAIGRSEWLQQRRPNYANVFRSLGWAQLALLGSAGTLGFYAGTDLEGGWFWLGAAVSLAGTAWLWARTEATPRGRASRWVLVAAFVVAHVPLLIPGDGWPVAAAVTFIGLWLVVAVAAQRAGQRGLLHLATALIALRLLITYFEVFGSLLGTGVGLVSGGLLTLLLTWVWVRKRRDFDSELPRGAVPIGVVASGAVPPTAVGPGDRAR